MKKSLLLSAGAGVLFLLVLLSGCMMQPPLKDTETILIYKFDSQAHFKMIGETSGTLTDAASQWSDCDKKMKSLIDMAVVAMQMSGDLNEEQKQQIEAFKKLKDMFTCEFEKNDAKKTGTLRLTFDLSEENIKALAKLSNQNMPETLKSIIKKNDDGTIEVNLGSSGGEIPQGLNLGGETNNKIKELRVYVEGELLEMKPAGYVKENGYYVFKDPESMKAGKFYLKYRPQDAGFFSIMGFNLSLEMLALIGGGIILLVIIIIVVILLKRRKKGKGETPFPQKPVQATAKDMNTRPPTQLYHEPAQQSQGPAQGRSIQRAGAQLGKTGQERLREPKWDSIVPSSKSKPQQAPLGPPKQRPYVPGQNQFAQPDAMQGIQQNRKAKTSYSTPLGAQQSSAVQQGQAPQQAESDEAKIERLLKLLKPKRFEYTEKEIRAVMKEEGYSDKIADEVIRRLGA